MTQLDAFKSVIAYHSAPYRIVKVQDETFLELPFHGAHNVYHATRYVGQYIHAQHHLCASIYIGSEHGIASQLVL